jgi:hypothetical protein
LRGVDASSAARGEERSGVYIDIMPDDTLVFADSPVSTAQLERLLRAYVSEGGRVATVRVAHGSSAERFEFVRGRAHAANLPVLERVRLAADGTAG